VARTTSAPKWATPGTVAARASIWAFVLYAFWQGTGIVLGGEARWSGPSFTYLRETPGAPASWGWVLIGLGLLLGFASLSLSWWLKLFALAGISVWSLGFASGAQYATSTVETAGTTGGPAYLLIAVLAAIVILPDESRKAV
jgi:hypothetical protein